METGKLSEPCSDALLDVEQVAQLLNVPKSWIYSASESGLLPSFKLGKYRRYKRSAIENWLLKQQDAPIKAVR